MSVSIIAEIGSVHDGSFGNAKKLIETAAECGANSVKFQMHIAGAETVLDAPSPTYFSAEPRFEYFNRTRFTLTQWKELKLHCEAHHLQFLVSPFSEQAVEVLESIGVDMYKVASGEVTNLPLLSRIARTGKPILLSSGMSSWSELDRAVKTIRLHNSRLTILQCTSQYPCEPKRVGLNVIPEMARRYDLPVGYSDHTQGPWAAAAAVVLGATVIEKHLTFSRRMYGSDAPYATEPGEFREMVRGIREIETMLAGAVDKNDVSWLKDMKQVFEKSVVAIIDLAPGAVITPDMVSCKKPGTGIPASEFQQVIGKRVKRAVKADTVLHLDDLESDS
jgi:N-acetylneuraminate synthase